MSAATKPDDTWGRHAPLREIPRPDPNRPNSNRPNSNRKVQERHDPNAPFAPDAWHLFRFWMAAPLTLLLFVPVLGAGLFGAPMILPGLYLAWRMLRAGRDGFYDFAAGGFQMGLVALIVSLPFGFGILYLFGMLFGPLMGMTFRVIAGDWRTRARGKTVTARIVSPFPITPSLARTPCTQ